MTAVPAAPPDTALEGVSIVLPCHDEAPNLLAAVRMASEAGRRHALAHEVIVVDDGSRDRTLSIATALAAFDPAVRVVVHPTEPRLRRRAALRDRRRAPAVGPADRRRPAARPRRAGVVRPAGARPRPDRRLPDRAPRPVRADRRRGAVEPARRRGSSICRSATSTAPSSSSAASCSTSSSWSPTGAAISTELLVGLLGRRCPPGRARRPPPAARGRPPERRRARAWWRGRCAS